MKFLKTLIWFFTAAPTYITNKVPVGTKCNYCEAEEHLVNFEGVFCICKHCLKKAADAVLLEVPNVKVRGGASVLSS